MTAPIRVDQRDVCVVVTRTGGSSRTPESDVPLVLIDGRPLPVKRVRLDVERADEAQSLKHMPPPPIYWLMLELDQDPRGEVVRMTVDPAPDQPWKDADPGRASMGHKIELMTVEEAFAGYPSSKPDLEGVVLYASGDGHEGSHGVVLDRASALALAADLTARAMRLPR